MKSRPLPLVFAVKIVLFVITAAHVATAQDVQSNLKGKSSCVPELETHRFSIRLDKTQHAFIATSIVDGHPIAAIVQFSSESERCGVIRDVVQTERKSTYFELECSAATAGRDVTIATRPLSESARKGYSDEAWRVDLKQLRFVRLRGKAFCTPSNYDGDDEGDDLATWARQRATKRR